MTKAKKQHTIKMNNLQKLKNNHRKKQEPNRVLAFFVSSRGLSVEGARATFRAVGCPPEPYTRSKLCQSNKKRPAQSASLH